MEDLDVCLQQLKLFLNEYDFVPYQVLNFLGAEINYGGRVTDDKDVRLIKTILETYINENIMVDGFKFSKSGQYYSPESGTHDDYMAYINSFDLNPKPEVFGLHDNAEVTTNQNATRSVLETVLSVQPRTSSGKGRTREQIIMELA